jgi:Ca2+-transporting ATPase
MVMDTLAAVALATEPPHPTELKQQRIKKHDRVILQGMWRTILGESIYQIITMMVLLYAGPWIFGIPYDLINCPFYTSSTN